MADSSTKKIRTEEYGVRTVKGRWSEWSVDGSGITCETKEQTSGLSTEDLAWLMGPFASTEQTGREAAERWISVSERLPDPYEVVQFLNAANEVCVGPRIVDDGRWEDMTSVDGYGESAIYGAEQVTHWAPLLPAPSKGEAGK